MIPDFGLYIVFLCVMIGVAAVVILSVGVAIGHWLF